MRRKLAVVGLGERQVFITKAPHSEVPDSLAASDCAFATSKPAPCWLFCSALAVLLRWPDYRR